MKTVVLFIRGNYCPLTFSEDELLPAIDLIKNAIMSVEGTLRIKDSEGTQLWCRGGLIDGYCVKLAKPGFQEKVLGILEKQEGGGEDWKK